MMYTVSMVKKAAKSSEQTILGRELCAFQFLAISQARGLLLPPPSPKKFTPTELFELNAFLENMDALLFPRYQSASRLSIGHFRVPKNLTFKARLSAKPLI